MWAFNIKTDILSVSVEFVVLSLDESPSKYTYSYVRNKICYLMHQYALKSLKLKLLPIHSESQNEYHKFKEYIRFWVAHLYESRVEFESI